MVPDTDLIKYLNLENCCLPETEEKFDEIQGYQLGWYKQSIKVKNSIEDDFCQSNDKMIKVWEQTQSLRILSFHESK